MDKLSHDCFAIIRYLPASPPPPLLPFPSLLLCGTRTTFTREHTVNYERVTLGMQTLSTLIAHGAHFIMSWRKNNAEKKCHVAHGITVCLRITTSCEQHGVEKGIRKSRGQLHASEGQPTAYRRANATPVARDCTFCTFRASWKKNSKRSRLTTSILLSRVSI